MLVCALGGELMDVGAVVSVISIATAVLGVACYVANLAFRFKRLEQQAEHRKEDTAIILTSLLATLDGLHQQGANGLVTKTKADLEAYIIKSR